MKAKIKFLIQLIFYKYFLKRDDMALKVQYYRDLGAKIGKNMRTFSPLTSAEPYLLEFGNDITVSSSVSFITHDNSISKVIPEATDLFGKIKIGNNCFIGMNSIIMPGIELADNTIVGAGSVVTKSFLQGNVVVAGNPAKVITSIENYKSNAHDYALNTLGLSQQSKKQLILRNKDKLLKK